MASRVRASWCDTARRQAWAGRGQGAKKVYFAGLCKPRQFIITGPPANRLQTGISRAIPCCPSNLPPRSCRTCLHPASRRLCHHEFRDRRRPIVRSAISCARCGPHRRHGAGGRRRTSSPPRRPPGPDDAAGPARQRMSPLRAPENPTRTDGGTAPRRAGPDTRTAPRPARSASWRWLLGIQLSTRYTVSASARRPAHVDAASRSRRMVPGTADGTPDLRGGCGTPTGAQPAHHLRHASA